MLLRSPKLAVVYSSQLFSLLADNLYLVALPWIVLQITGSTLALGSVFALAAVPRAVLLPFGGVLADRIGQRSIMLTVSLIRSLVLAVLAVLLAKGDTWALYLAAPALGTLTAFYYPAEGSVIPRLVADAHLPAANGLVQGTTQLLGILGPALGGVTVGAVGGEMTLLVAAGAYLVAAVVLGFLRLGPVGTTVRPSFLKQLREGLGVVWADAVLRWLILVIALVNLSFVGPFFVGVPALVKDVFGLGAEAFGGLTAAFSLGSLVGVTLSSFTGRFRAKGELAVSAATLTYLSLGLLGLAPAYSYSFGLLLVAGIGSGVQNILLVTLVQLRVPKALLGRVISLVLVGSFGLAPLSQLLAGLFAEKYDVRLLFPLGASTGLIVLLIGARWIIELGQDVRERGL